MVRAPDNLAQTRTLARESARQTKFFHPKEKRNYSRGLPPDLICPKSNPPSSSTAAGAAPAPSAVDHALHPPRLTCATPSGSMAAVLGARRPLPPNASGVRDRRRLPPFDTTTRTGRRRRSPPYLLHGDEHGRSPPWLPPSQRRARCLLSTMLVQHAP